MKQVRSSGRHSTKADSGVICEQSLSPQRDTRLTCKKELHGLNHGSCQQKGCWWFRSSQNNLKLVKKLSP